jgi:hypothetical protein
MCLPKYVIEGKTEEMGRLKKRCKVLLDDFMGKKKYWN